MVEFLRVRILDSPVLVSIPHSGTILPDYATKFSQRKIFEKTDVFLDRIVEPLQCSYLFSNLSSLWVNLNRPLKPWRVGPATFRRGPFTHLDDNGNVVKNNLKSRELEIGMRTYLLYHRFLAAILDFLRKRHGLSILVDIHSYNRFPLPGLPGKGERPGVNISGESEYASFLSSHLTFNTSINYPYTGGYIIKRYGRMQNVIAIQIEIRKDLYTKGLNFSKTKGKRVSLEISRALNSFLGKVLNQRS